MKIFIAYGIRLPQVPTEHLAVNGDCRFTILVRAATPERAAELIPDQVGLRMSGWVRSAPVTLGLGCGNGLQKAAAVALKSEVIYYLPGPPVEGWFEYKNRANLSGTSKIQ